MNKTRNRRRGDRYLADLNPFFGSAQDGMLPSSPFPYPHFAADCSDSVSTMLSRPALFKE